MGRHHAGIAQLVERNLAKVEVASSSLVSRSTLSLLSLYFCLNAISVVYRRLLLASYCAAEGNLS